MFLTDDRGSCSQNRGLEDFLGWCLSCDSNVDRKMFCTSWIKRFGADLVVSNHLIPVKERLSFRGNYITPGKADLERNLGGVLGTFTNLHHSFLNFHDPKSHRLLRFGLDWTSSQLSSRYRPFRAAAKADCFDEERQHMDGNVRNNTFKGTTVYP